MAIARREIGTKEVVGSRHSPRVLQYHGATRLQARDDETPWCASFVCWVLEQSCIASTRSAAAIHYETWGQALESPTVGAIVVFDRPTLKNPRSRHVAFFDHEDGDDWYVLGGNQRNQVCIAPYPRDRVNAVRWPLIS